VRKDLENDMTTMQTASKVYRVAIDEETMRIDERKTEQMRDEERRDRKEGGIPARKYLAKERESIIKGDLTPVVKEMYNDSFRISDRFAQEFREFWELDAGFAF